MKAPMRWDELDAIEQYEIIKVVNHLASFTPDSAARILIYEKIRKAALYNPFLQNK